MLEEALTNPEVWLQQGSWLLNKAWFVEYFFSGNLGLDSMTAYPCLILEPVLLCCFCLVKVPSLLASWLPQLLAQASTTCDRGYRVLSNKFMGDLRYPANKSWFGTIAVRSCTVNIWNKQILFFGNLRHGMPPNLPRPSRGSASGNGGWATTATLGASPLCEALQLFGPIHRWCCYWEGYIAMLCQTVRLGKLYSWLLVSTTWKWWMYVTTDHGPMLGVGKWGNLKPSTGFDIFNWNQPTHISSFQAKTIP